MWKYIKRSNNKTVAVKIIHLTLLDQRKLTLLKEEIRLLEILPQHPYIIKYYKTFQDTTKKINYLVMQYIEGGNLSDWL